VGLTGRKEELLPWLSTLLFRKAYNGIKPMQGEDFLKNMVMMVANERLMLHDDLDNLVSKEKLIEVIYANTKLNEKEVIDLFNKGLIFPVEQGLDNPLYHASITIDFLRFLTKLQIAGYPAKLQQKIAEMYFPLFWDMCTDIDYEISSFKNDKGRDPSKFEVAYLRVINEWAAADMMTSIEEKILKLEPEGNRELEELIKEEAQKRNRLKKKANFGFQENQIKKVISEIWLSPLKCFQGREIKAFVDIQSINWTDSEKKLLWGGHFDFALCDESGVIQIAIEYNGGGHYGKSSNESEEVRKRDSTKKSICDKAAIPLIILTAEFALLKEYQKIFKMFLTVFKAKLKQADSDILFNHIQQVLNSIITNGFTADKLDLNETQLITPRLEMYKSQGRSDMLLALLWQVCSTYRKLPELTTALTKICN